MSTSPRPEPCTGLTVSAELRNGVRRLRQLREEAPADHHRYLLWLTIHLIGAPRPVSEILPMYYEEFDVGPDHTL